MANYRIDDQHSNTVCDGIQNIGHAQEIAQRRANERGESVWIYGDDLGDEGYEVAPETGEE